MDRLFAFRIDQEETIRNRFGFGVARSGFCILLERDLSQFVVRA